MSWKTIDQTPGFFNFRNYCLWHSLFDIQNELMVPGHMFEVGVFHGRTALTLAHFLRPSETLTLVESNAPLYPDVRKTIAAALGDEVAGRVTALHKDSRTLRHHPLTDSMRRSMRFMHIDGAHTAENVFDDLELADMIVSDNGLVAVDDFNSNRFPQVTQATYIYLDRNPFKFHLLMIGFKKAYLCRPRFFETYMTAFEGTLLGRMRQHGYPVSGYRQYRGPATPLGIDERDPAQKFDDIIES